MENETIKRIVEKAADALSTLSRDDLLKAYGFVLGLQANKPAS